MNKPSKLELYLRNQEAQGSTDSGGSFTISRDDALAKLASYQLPFEGAWIVKLVQAGVAHQGIESMHFTLTNRESLFSITGNCNWSLDQLNKALLTPANSGDRSLSHLVTGLRMVGFGEKRAFWIEVPGTSEQIVWDGSRIGRATSREASTTFRVTISNKRRNDDSGLFGLAGHIDRSRRNATASQCLYKYCHASPKPLFLDGTSIEGLEMSPDHGWGAKSQLIALGFGDGNLPKLKIPPRTASRSAVSETVLKKRLFEVTTSQETIESHRTTYGIAFLLAAHLSRDREENGYTWNVRSEDSLFYWISDGVIVQSDPIGLSPGLCSVGCFVSAEGLKTDLSGLRLVDSQEKQQRVQTARELLKENLVEPPSLAFEGSIGQAEKDEKRDAALIAAVGTGMLLGGPWSLSLLFIKGAIIGASFGGLSTYIYKSAGKPEARRAQEVSDALVELFEELSVFTIS